MKKVIVISTSLRPGSNSDTLANHFVEGAKGHAKLQAAFELGKSIS